jgi:non-specific serine/threonine protein kinase
VTSADQAFGLSEHRSIRGNIGAAARFVGVHPVLPSLSLAVVPLERVLSGGDGPVPPPIASELRAMAARLRDLAQAGARAYGSLHREGDYWTVAHEGCVLRLRHSKGMAYLARLVAQPDVEVHAVALETDAPVGRAPAAPRLDLAAKTAYRARLAELRDQLAAAHERCDRPGGECASAEIEREIAALLRELAAGIGLGGRDRTFASAAERARVNVTRNLHSAIGRIAVRSAVLGRHLATSVRTGGFCCYAPDPAAEIRWLVAP